MKLMFFDRMTVGQLKIFLQKRFKVNANVQNLMIRMDKKSFPTPLDDDTAELSYYGLQVHFVQRSCSNRILIWFVVGCTNYFTRKRGIRR